MDEENFSEEIITEVKTDNNFFDVPESFKRSNIEINESSTRNLFGGPDIVFLFALPVTLETQLAGQKREFVDFGQIDWRRELNEIKNLLQMSGPC